MTERRRYSPIVKKTFEQARDWVRKQRFTSVQEFQDWATGKSSNKRRPKKPDWLPSNPHHAFAEQWVSYSDFLGTATVANYNREFLDFEAAREWVRTLALRTTQDWLDYCSGVIVIPGKSPRPSNIPSNPAFVYRELGWVGIRDWLGSGVPTYPMGSKFRSFEAARDWVHTLELPTYTAWRSYVGGELELPAKPADIPACPHVAYKGKGWVNYGDWLGTDSEAFHQKEWAPLSEVAEFVYSLKIRTEKQWRAYCRGEYPNLPPKPKNIPYSLLRIYAKHGFTWRSY